MSKKNMMDDPIFRNYEWGKVNTVTSINDIIEDVLQSDVNDKDKFKVFIKRFRKYFKGYFMEYGTSKPTKFEKKFCYLDTYIYRGIKVDVFDDDYGQQYYFYFNGRSIGCGAYNTDYKHCIEYEVDHYLDDIFSYSEIDKIYSGAYLKYNNHEHTEIVLTYRMDELQVWTLEEGEEFDIDVIKYSGLGILDSLFESEEFKKSEAERKAKGDLYFNEIIEQWGKGHKDKKEDEE